MGQKKNALNHKPFSVDGFLCKFGVNSTCDFLAVGSPSDVKNGLIGDASVCDEICNKKKYCKKTEQMIFMMKLTHKTPIPNMKSLTPNEICVILNEIQKN